MSREFCFEFDVDFDCDQFQPRWACICLVQTEGRDLEDLLANVMAFACDQDGGDLGEADLTNKQMDVVIDMITKRYYEELVQDCPF
jgi:hypothetical protein